MRDMRCQVLMAGAMRPDSAGLKSISAKHLALSSQSLGMFLTLMPHIKAVLAAYVPEAQRSLLKEMDSAATDYEEHQQQLFSKLVEQRRTARRRGSLAQTTAISRAGERRGSGGERRGLPRGGSHRRQHGLTPSRTKRLVSKQPRGPRRVRRTARDRSNGAVPVRKPAVLGQRILVSRHLRKADW